MNPQMMTQTRFDEIIANAMTAHNALFSTTDIYEPIDLHLSPIYHIAIESMHYATKQLTNSLINARINFTDSSYNDISDMTTIIAFSDKLLDTLYDSDELDDFNFETLYTSIFEFSIDIDSADDMIAFLMQ